MVAIHGPQPHHVFSPLYRCAWVPVPFTDERFGLPILEAMVSKKPVICSERVVFRELCARHRTFPDRPTHRPG